MKIIKALIIIAVIILSVYIGGKYLYEPRQNVSVYADTENPLVAFATNENTKINSFRNNTFFITSRNSTKLIDDSGNIVWEKPISLINPKTSISKKYLAVGDVKGGNSINVFDSSSYLYTISLANEVIDFTINDNGYVSLIEKDLNGYIIKLFNNKNEEILKKTIYDVNIYPVKAVCSNDNKFLAYTIIDTNYINIKTDVSFLLTSGNDTNQYVGDSGEFAGKNYDNEIAYELKFINDKFFVFTDLNIYIYDFLENDVRDISKIQLNNALVDYEFINDKFLAISLGNGFNSQSNYNMGTILAYDLSGALKYEKYGENIEVYLSSDKSNMIVLENRNIYNMSLNGNILWSYTSSEDLKDMVYIGNSSRATIATNSNIIAIKNRNR